MTTNSERRTPLEHQSECNRAEQASKSKCLERRLPLSLRVLVFDLSSHEVDVQDAVLPHSVGSYSAIGSSSALAGLYRVQHRHRILPPGRREDQRQHLRLRMFPQTNPGLEPFRCRVRTANPLQTKENFGLISRQYDTDARSDPWNRHSQWQRFESKVNSLNAHSDRHTQYKVIWFGRHGEGFHNVAESYYGTPAWNVSQLQPLSSYPTNAISSATGRSKTATAPSPGPTPNSPKTASTKPKSRTASGSRRSRKTLFPRRSPSILRL